MTVYCISGLGADHRAFERLQWAPNLRIVHLPWLEPSPNESLQAYAHRMAKPIQNHEPFALIGLSFGGILAIEMLHFLQPYKTIIISSISNNTQLPWYFRVVGKTKLYKSPLANTLKQNAWFIDSLFGKKNTPLALYLKEKFRAMSNIYLNWSLEHILSWEQKEKPTGLIHIHGTADKVFPIEYTQPDIIIRGGSHFMIYTHAKQVSKHLQQILTYQL